MEKTDEKNNSSEIKLAPKLLKLFEDHLTILQSDLRDHKNEINSNFSKSFSPDSLKKVFEELLKEKNEKIQHLTDLRQIDAQEILQIKGDKAKLITEKEESEKQHTENYNQLTKVKDADVSTIKKELKVLKEKEENFQDKLNEQKTKYITELSKKDQELKKADEYKADYDEEINLIKEYFSEELYDHCSSSAKKYKIIRTISYLISGLGDMDEQREIRRIFTDSFEANIALFISSLLVRFGIDDEKFKDVLAKVNEQLKIYNIDEPDGIGDLIQNDKHEKANQGGRTIKEYRTLSISSKIDSQIVRKALVQS